MSENIYGLFCGVCQCILDGKFKYQEIVECAYCGRQWTLVELLLGIECNDWSKK